MVLKILLGTCDHCYVYIAIDVRNKKMGSIYLQQLSMWSKLATPSIVSLMFSLFLLSDDRYVENDLACLTNIGDVQVFSVPPLRRQLKADCIRKENVRWGSLNVKPLNITPLHFFPTQTASKASLMQEPYLCTSWTLCYGDFDVDGMLIWSLCT